MNVHFLVWFLQQPNELDPHFMVKETEVQSPKINHLYVEKISVSPPDMSFNIYLFFSMKIIKPKITKVVCSGFIKFFYFKVYCPIKNKSKNCYQEKYY